MTALNKTTVCFLSHSYQTVYFCNYKLAIFEAFDVLRKIQYFFSSHLSLSSWMHNKKVVLALKKRHHSIPVHFDCLRIEIKLMNPTFNSTTWLLFGDIWCPIIDKSWNYGLLFHEVGFKKRCQGMGKGQEDSEKRGKGLPKE